MDLFPLFTTEENALNYRNVMIKTDAKVKDLYDVEERLGT